MQSIAVANIPHKTASGAAPATSGASDGSTSGGVDFAALLATQFQGKGRTALPSSSAGVTVKSAPAEPNLKVDIPLDPKAELAKNTDSLLQQDLKAETAKDPKAKLTQDTKTDPAADAKAGGVVDPALQGMVLVPGFSPVAQAMQQSGVAVKQGGGARSSDAPNGGHNVSALAGLADTPIENGRTQPQVKEGAAEFAVSGKLLPSGDPKLAETKFADALKLSNPSVDTQRTPDSASVVPALMNLSQTGATGDVKSPVAVVQPQVGSPGWGDALGQKVVWMAGQNHQVAELHLNPPNLGPMEVRLTVSHDQVSAIFVSHQPAVREAIEAAMPRLREMFADSGMTLGNAMVSSDSLPQQQNSGQERQSGSSGSRSDFPLVDGYSTPVTSQGVMPLPVHGRGVVDFFA